MIIPMPMIIMTAMMTAYDLKTKMYILILRILLFLDPLNQHAVNKPSLKCWILLKKLNTLIRNQHSSASWFILLLHNCLLLLLLLCLGCSRFPFPTWTLWGCSCTLSLPSLPFLCRRGSGCRLGSLTCSFRRRFIFFFIINCSLFFTLRLCVTGTFVSTD